MSAAASVHPTPDAPNDESSPTIAWALAPGTLLAGVAGGIAFPILPIAAARVGLPVVFIGVILAANRAMRVVSSPWVGLYADRNGGRRTLLVGLALQIAVLSLYALGIVTRQVGSLFLIGRLLHGPASACVFVSAQALALQAGGRSMGGRSAGIVRASIVLGVPVGLAVGGLLSDAVGDAAAFFAAAVAVLLALIVAYVRVPDLRVPIAQGASFKERLLAMRDRRLFALGALNLVVNFAAAGMILTTLALLVRERHLSLFGRNLQGTSGLLMGVLIVCDAATTPLAGRLGDRFHAHARVAAVSMTALVAGLVVVGLSTTVPGVAAGLAVMGVGTAGLGPSLLVLMSALIPRERRGTGVGLMQFCGDLGGMLGPLAGTALLTTSTSLPYLGTAVLVTCSIPLALWLARLEARAVTRPA